VNEVSKWDACDWDMLYYPALHVLLQVHLERSTLQSILNCPTNRNEIVC